MIVVSQTIGQGNRLRVESFQRLKLFSKHKNDYYASPVKKISSPKNEFIVADWLLELEVEADTTTTILWTILRANASINKTLRHQGS
jgi:hypothetical protein